MHVELLEIGDFLGQQRPFDQLPSEELVTVSAELSIRYVRRDGTIPERDDGEAVLNIVRAGAVELRSAEGELLARLGEGDLLGYRAIAHDTGTVSAVAIEDSLLYRLPAAVVDRLCMSHRPFEWFFAPPGGDRLRGAIRERDEGGDDTPLNLMTTLLRDVLAREPIHLPPSASVRETAERMSVERVSSMLIVEQGHLFGIVTDRDLRLRVIAAGLDTASPVSDIMTGAPVTIDIDTFAYEALLTMARHRIHHLPVIEGDAVAGVVTTSDFFERHSSSAIYLAADIHRQEDIDGLIDASGRVPALLGSLAAAGAPAGRTGRVLSGVADALVVRLLELAERKAGPPPVDYAWIVAGSQARGEQTVASDQDNALVLDNAYDPELHGAYFETLTQGVCDALDACGQVHCPGEMMASNPKWRLPLDSWKSRFATWIDEPDPAALMLTCTFFDMRHVYGDGALVDTLRRFALERARGNSIFLSHLTGNALSRQPPLGFFRNFVLSRGSGNDSVFDLKRDGVVPIVDLARVHSLASGADAVNTLERLEAASASGEISASGARDLTDALAFIANVRLAHQARQLNSGEVPDNLVSPALLSHFERNHLKDAFVVVRTMQRALAQRYGKS